MRWDDDNLRALWTRGTKDELKLIKEREGPMSKEDFELSGGKLGLKARGLLGEDFLTSNMIERLELEEDLENMDTHDDICSDSGELRKMYGPKHRPRPMTMEEKQDGVIRKREKHLTEMRKER